MDASETLQAEACCDVCGYPRRGLANTTLCPECGAMPPVMVSTGLGPQEVTDLTRSITQSQLRWLTTIGIGLALFLFYSIQALQVTLVMSVGSFELGAVNFPGPKLNGTTPIQRAIGGQPGQWGVAGAMAMLFQVAAIWLLTERRALRGDWERTFSLRFAARWVSILTAGGLLGAALSGAGDYIPPMGNGSGGLLIAAVLLCELPSNTLLYLYLKELAGELGSKRAAALLRACVWLVPIVTLGGAIQITIDTLRDSEAGMMWHVATAIYGATAVATGAAATAAVGYLLAMSLTAAFGAWLSKTPHLLRQAPALLRQTAAQIEKNAPRWFVVAGLLLWLGLLPASAVNAIWQPGRSGYLGNIPMLNFIGPKVIAVVELNRNNDEPGNSTVATALLGLAAVWLMTAKSSEGQPSRLARAARLSATLAVGASLGIRFGLWSNGGYNSFILAFAVGLCEIPATILLYLYLAQLAKRAGESPTALRWICVAIPIIAGSALAALPLAATLQFHRHDTITAMIGAAEIAASLSLTFVAASALLRLSGALIRQAANLTSHPAHSAPPPPVSGHPA